MPVPPVTPVPPVVPVPPDTKARFGARKLWVNPNGSAARAAQAAPSGSYERKVFEWYAARPVAVWYGGWGGALDNLKAAADRARKADQVLTVVLYNIPNRDASGGYSAGGAVSYPAYDTWLDDAMRVVGDTPTIWIVEPDALADLDAMGDRKQMRLDLIKQTGHKLKTLPNSWVYLDAGNYSWQSPATMADRLSRSGIGGVDGFSVNVSGFGEQAKTLFWAEELSGLLDSAHYIIDTSRNGAGPWTNPNGPTWDDWCNPPGRLVGLPPQIQPTERCDAYLWVKPTGESDGNCKGGPNAGDWWASYALECAREAVPR